MQHPTWKLRHSLIAAFFSVFLGMGSSAANACLENMNIVKTTTGLMAAGKYDEAYDFSIENFDACPMQARFFAAQLIIEGHKNVPVCEAVAILEGTFHLNNERNTMELIRETNEKSVLQLLNWVYLERYLEFSIIEGSAYSLKLFLERNQDRFEEVSSYTDEGYYSHKRLKQLLTYANHLGVDVRNFPKLLEVVGEDFKPDDFLLKNGWPKKVICDVRMK
ncbi:MAG: hypothetical protein K5905_06830 [Roseibium sp.]|uniref:hypothetical protein n=1 Tax=Roseibium sp. TaxID=1936156 RepID=UPI0026056DBB|nr:hypothetical protein [Roseibium sp.]MCV0425168.1 hypothetical protein [Roseibium sp.]